MGDFQRSPSKVWWANDYSNHDRSLQNQSWIHHIKDSSIEETFERNENVNTENYVSHFDHNSSPSSLPPDLHLSVNNNSNRTRSSLRMLNTCSPDNQLHSTNKSWLNRTSSGSPNSHKSQDSGFSDSETSPVLQQNLSASDEEQKSNCFCRQNGTQYETPKRYTKQEKTSSITSNLLKDTSLNETPIKNFTANVKEKYSPKKSLACHLNEKSLNKTFTQNSTCSKEYVDTKPTYRSLPSTPYNCSNHVEYKRCFHVVESRVIPTINAEDHEMVTSFQTSESPIASFRLKRTENQNLTPDKKYSPVIHQIVNQNNTKNFSGCKNISTLHANKNVSQTKHIGNDNHNYSQQEEFIHKQNGNYFSPNGNFNNRLNPPPKSHSEPIKRLPDSDIKKPHFHSPKLSPKVNRNLFSCFPSNGNSIEDVSKLDDWEPQIISDDNENNIEKMSITNHSLNTPTSDTAFKSDYSFSPSSASIEYPTVIQNKSAALVSEPKYIEPNLNSKSPVFKSNFNRTFPIVNATNQQKDNKQMNTTAPVGKQLKYDPNNISFQDTSNSSDNSQETMNFSDSEKGCISEDLNDSGLLEQEGVQLDNFDPPTCTSTPKCLGSISKKDMFRRNIIRHVQNKECSTTNEISLSRVNLQTTATPSVSKWLDELASLYEAECMVTLQSKSLAADLSRQVAEAAATATTTIKSLLALSKIIYSEFSTIQKQLAGDSKDHIKPLIQSLAGNITEFIVTYTINSQAGSMTKTNQREQEVHEMLNICDSLRQSTSANNFDDLLFNIGKLKSIFRETEINILTCQIQLLINMIEEPTSELVLRGAVQAITWIAAQGYRIGGVNLISRLVICGAPRALLSVCLESRASTLRASALRALATVCCSSVAIRQLEQAGGIEILADILAETTRPEPELSEAAAVIAQITAPWIEDNHCIRGLKENAKSIIQSLTYLFQTTHCCQILLLCAAALANLSSMEPTSVWPLLQCRTAEKLLQTVQKRGPKVSVFLKEQTSTLIANMSAASESRLQLGEGKAVVAMLCFLQTRPEIADSINDPEHKATQRLLQKSAIALSRLCSERSLAQQVVELGGVPQLIRLCKEKRERGHSDAVLVACLATLRKITANCGLDVMEEQDAMELVEPKLLDSFLTYSSQNESYV